MSVVACPRPFATKKKTACFSAIAIAIAILQTSGGDDDNDDDDAADGAMTMHKYFNGKRAHVMDWEAVLVIIFGSSARSKPPKRDIGTNVKHLQPKKAHIA
ncbi:unnamed protein product [Ceratitis capitata]|uniref:(Mediterranean fruit fly) hypothetical protein n=1 Tax=Ceratitis capitata TaxID=7213 RepID=A0A811VHR5_CERCA|nr:unnamed protein product [Ceratitis capitata]